jgi:hypothetical protein
MSFKYKKVLFDCNGYNMSCFFNSQKNEYIATIRETTDQTYYPETINKTKILYLNENFDIKSSCYLNENISIKHLSYSEGIEDCRLINEKSLLCTALHTNAHWKPEMCYVEFENNEITKLKQLYIEGQQYTKIEKNWLFLKKQDNYIFCLYYYNPFQIISIDTDTGKGTIIKEYNVPGVQLKSHGAASVYLKHCNKYLVAIRNISNHKFEGNHFLVFSDEYDLLAISDNFYFSDTKDSYQMCMSLILKNNEDNCEPIINAFVSVNDKDCYIYEFKLNDILEKCYPINKESILSDYFKCYNIV